MRNLISRYVHVESMLNPCWIHVESMSQTGHPDSSKLFNKRFKVSSFWCVFITISEQVRKRFHTCEHVQNVLIWGAGNAVSFLNAGTVLQQSYLVNGSEWVRFPSENSTIRDHVFGWFFFHTFVASWKKHIQMKKSECISGAPNEPIWTCPVT